MGYSITDSCAENGCPDLRSFFAREQKVVLFGAGKNGEFISHYLKFAGLSAECFVDNASARIGSSMNGLRIESSSILKDQGIVITSELHADAIMAQLFEAGLHREHIYVLRQRELQRIYDSEPGWPAYIARHYFAPTYRKYFEERGVDCDGERLTHGGYTVLNPFLQTDAYQIAFFSGAVDFVLPAMFQDHSMLVEGLGELGAVSVVPGDVVFDCGANIGLFSLLAAAKGCKVFAFEPAPDALEYLKQTARIHPSIEIQETATSDRSGTTRISLSQGNNTSSSFVLPVEGDTFEITTTSIDDFVEMRKLPSVDFIKADIEGAERLMLAGAVETLRRFAPKLSICTYHLPDDKEVLESLIRQANPNYVIEHRWQKLYAHVPDKFLNNLVDIVVHPET